MSEPRRGDVWWVELPGKRRPVLVLTRDAAIPVLQTVLVAPITKRTRGIATEVALDESDGMPVACVASLDTVTTAAKANMTHRITRLDSIRMRSVCEALAVAVQC